jgi:hypothetical protein
MLFFVVFPFLDGGILVLCPKVKNLISYLQVSHRKVKNRPLGGGVEPLIRAFALETFHTSFLYQVVLSL